MLREKNGMGKERRISLLDLSLSVPFTFSNYVTTLVDRPFFCFLLGTFVKNKQMIY